MHLWDTLTRVICGGSAQTRRTPGRAAITPQGSDHCSHGTSSHVYFWRDRTSHTSDLRSDVATRRPIADRMSVSGVLFRRPIRNRMSPKMRRPIWNQKLKRPNLENPEVRSQKEETSDIKRSDKKRREKGLAIIRGNFAKKNFLESFDPN